MEYINDNDDKSTIYMDYMLLYRKRIYVECIVNNFARAQFGSDFVCRHRFAVASWFILSRSCWLRESGVSFSYTDKRDI